MDRRQERLSEDPLSGGKASLFPSRPWWKRYLVAVLLSICATGMRFGLIGLDPHAPYVTFYPAVVLTAFYGGLGPGLLATALCGLAATYWLEPRGALFLITDTTDVIGLAYFLISCMMIAATCEAMHHARARAAAAEIQSRLAEERRRAEKALRESEMSFRSLFDVAAVPTAVQGSDGHIVRTNPAYREFLGYSEEESRSLTIEDITHPDDRSATRTARQQLLTGELGLFRTEKRYLHKDRRVLWGDLNVSLVRDAQGQPLYFVAQVQDITERKRAEEALRQSEEQFRTAFEDGAIAMALTAPDGTLLKVNLNFCQMLGYAASELTSRSFTVITHPDDLPANLAGIDRILRGEAATFRMVKRYVHKEGRIIWGDMCTALVRSVQGQPLHFVTHIQDITERKRTEDDLRKANEILAEADRRKDEFLAMLAHELRNPLAPIRNAVQILSLAGPHDPRLERQRAIIDRQVTHMAHLLDDLLDMSRVSRGRIQLHKTRLQLAEVLAQAVEMAEPLIEARRHQLHYAPPPEALGVEGDSDRLTQAVGNLLSNAAKYTAEGGQIWLDAAPEGDQVTIRVRDTGIGIAPEMLPRVFDLFAQADQTLARTQGGLGIGLSMVKRLVELHGGTVEAHSGGLGQGSEFIIRLPCSSHEASL